MRISASRAKAGQLQLSSVNLAGSGLRPVTRSSAIAESTFDARVFLLGSGSTSLAWAGGAKPVDSGGLLAQPASKPAEAASAQRRIAQRTMMSTARCSMPRPPRFPPAMTATLGRGQTLPTRTCLASAKSACPHLPPTRATRRRLNRCEQIWACSPAFVWPNQRNEILREARSGLASRSSMPGRRAHARNLLGSIHHRG